MKKLAVTCLVATGCMRPSTSIVRNLDIVGHELVIETCGVRAEKDSVKLDRCRTTRRTLPVLVATETPMATPPFSLTIDRKELARQFADARPALTACAAQQTVSADLRIRFVIASTGEVSIDVAGASPEVATCVTGALSSVRLQYEPATVAITFKPLASP